MVDLSALIGGPKPLLVNTDMDGIFSALLLTNYWGATVGGFCNSKDRIWVRNDLKLKDCIVVDMYVASNQATCIDQHMIAVDKDHAKKIGWSGRVANPNLDRSRVFDGAYATKYPLSTAAYLLSLVPVPDEWFNFSGHTPIMPLAEMFYRADDILFISRASSYTKNAADWWQWLERGAINPKAIAWTKSLIDRVDPSEAAEIKARASTSLVRDYHCTRPDGGMERVTDDAGTATPDWQRLAYDIATASGLKPLDFSGTYTEWVGEPVRYSATYEDLHDLKTTGHVRGRRVVSYAFVRGPFSHANLSVTHAPQAKTCPSAAPDTTGQEMHTASVLV